MGELGCGERRSWGWKVGRGRKGGGASGGCVAERKGKEITGRERGKRRKRRR